MRRQKLVRPTMHEESITHSLPRERERGEGTALHWLLGRLFFPARKHAILFALAAVPSVALDALSRSREMMMMIEIGSNFLKERVRHGRREKGREGGREGGKANTRNACTHARRQARPRP